MTSQSMTSQSMTSQLMTSWQGISFATNNVGNSHAGCLLGFGGAAFLGEHGEVHLSVGEGIPQGKSCIADLDFSVTFKTFQTKNYFKSLQLSRTIKLQNYISYFSIVFSCRSLVFFASLFWLILFTGYRGSEPHFYLEATGAASLTFIILFTGYRGSEPHF